MSKLRRRVYTWLASVLNVQAHVDRQSLLAMYRLGGSNERKRIQSEMEYAANTFYAPHTRTYEPPERTTDQIKPVARTKKLLPLENVIGPTATQSLPAVNAQGQYTESGKYMRKAAAWRKQQEQQSS